MRAFISFFFLFSFALDASQQQTMTTSQKQELSYLRQANQNVVEADELMDISLYELERQGEVIRRVHRKNVEINGSLDRADKTLTEMENPWFPSLLVKSSGPSDLQHNVNVFYRKKNPFEVMDGYMWKRSRWLRQWRLRYFSLEGNRLVYYHTKEDKEEQKDWKSYLRLEEFHGVEKVECKKVGKFCFRLLTHKLEKRIYFSIAAKGNYQDWFRHLTDIIKPGSRVLRENVVKKKKNPYEKAKDKYLTETIETLDRLGDKARLMGHEVDTQNKVLGKLILDFNATSDRIDTNRFRTRAIK